jgi:hypothetical protein
LFSSRKSFKLFLAFQKGTSLDKLPSTLVLLSSHADKQLKHSMLPGNPTFLFKEPSRQGTLSIQE